jgi:hypothetical protein
MARTLRGNYNPKQNANTRRNCGGKKIPKITDPKLTNKEGKKKRRKKRQQQQQQKMSERENGLKRIPFKKENPKK